MIIVYAEIECLINHAQSLKEKRSVIKPLLLKIRRDYNVSIAEVDFQSLWQRAKFAIVTVSNEIKNAEQVIQQVLKAMEANGDLEITRSEEHTSELQSRGRLVCRL